MNIKIQTYMLYIHRLLVIINIFLIWVGVWCFNVQRFNLWPGLGRRTWHGLFPGRTMEAAMEHAQVFPHQGLSSASNGGSPASKMFLLRDGWRVLQFMDTKGLATPVAEGWGFIHSNAVAGDAKCRWHKTKVANSLMKLSHRIRYQAYFIYRYPVQHIYPTDTLCGNPVR